MKVNNLRCEKCSAPLIDHPHRNSHAWQLRQVDRPHLNDAEMAQVVDILDARRSSVDLPSPAERRRIREDAGWSQGEVADALGVSRWAVTLWEKEQPTPRTPQRELARLYSELLETLRSRNLQRASS